MPVLGFYCNLRLTACGPLQETLRTYGVAQSEVFLEQTQVGYTLAVYPDRMFCSTCRLYSSKLKTVVRAELIYRCMTTTNASKVLPHDYRLVCMTCQHVFSEESLFTPSCKKRPCHYLLQTELAGVRERYEVAVSDVQAVRAESAQEVERLTQRLSDGDNDRKQLELKLESTAHELATTVQLSELALAAKSAAGEEERQEEETRRATEEAQRAEELVGLGLLFLSTPGAAAEVAPFCLSSNIMTDIFGKESSIGFFPCCAPRKTSCVKTMLYPR